MHAVPHWGSILAGLWALFWSGVSGAAASPQLFRIGATPTGGRITFANVTRPEARPTTLFGANPIIRGANLYGPDLLRVEDRWYCYHGGWLTSGQTNDRIYLGISASLDVTGPWNPASQLVIHNGDYLHVHDPSVAIHDGTWYMVYTAYKSTGGARDWINYSTSTDGMAWSPSAGTASTEIVVTDPNNVAGGPFSDMARPSLVRTPTEWRIWFDARVNDGPPISYLAQSNSQVPSHFVLVRRYQSIEGTIGFFEPDVVRRPDGTYLAVVQRHSSRLYIGTSTDGLNFTLTPDVSISDPVFGRNTVSNPGLVYDQVEDRLLGLSFGMSNNWTDHDIGFSATQYKIDVRSPDGVWHTQSQAGAQDCQWVLTPGHSTFDRVRITDPVTNTVVLDESFTAAVPGDLWYVHWDPAVPYVAPIEPALDSVFERTAYVRPIVLLAGQEPIHWSLVEAPESARIDDQGVVRWEVPSYVDPAAQTFTVTFRVRAENGFGAIERGWQVKVLLVLDGLPDFDGDGDADMEDFGLSQSCLGVKNFAAAPVCAKADLNGDGRVDRADLDIWMGCMSGANVPANPLCVP